MSMLNKIASGLCALTFISAAGAAQLTPATYAQETARAYRSLDAIRAHLQGAQPLQQINWPVGDFHKLKIEFIMPGDGRKEVRNEEVYQGKNAFWYVTTINLMGQAQKTEALMDRADGSTLRLIVNGKEESTNDGSTVEIIEQAETTITVPAGTFDCIYVKAKVTPAQGQPQEVELWVNPIDVNLDGALKIAFQTQFGPLAMVLEEFGPRH